MQTSVVLYDLYVLIEVPPSELKRIKPMFEELPGLHGCVHAALEGTMGTVYADDVQQPSLALIDLEFYFFAGDPGAETAEHAVRNVELPASMVVPNGSWEPLLRRVWGEALRARTRVAFQPGDWEHSQLRSMREALPKGLAVCRVHAGNVARFEQLAESLVYNFDSLEDFAARGVGFGIEADGRFISGCSSFAISSHSLEFEIQTHPDYRRRGLALATAAALIEYCLDHGLEPCWDAHNSMSAALATKLGFVEVRSYKAYELPPDAQPAG